MRTQRLSLGWARVQQGGQGKWQQIWHMSATPDLVPLPWTDGKPEAPKEDACQRFFRCQQQGQAQRRPLGPSSGSLSGLDAPLVKRVLFSLKAQRPSDTVPRLLNPGQPHPVPLSPSQSAPSAATRKPGLQSGRQREDPSRFTQRCPSGQRSVGHAHSSTSGGGQGQGPHEHVPPGPQPQLWSSLPI